jgi:hypothetical protein
METGIKTIEEAQKIYAFRMETGIKTIEEAQKIYAS